MGRDTHLYFPGNANPTWGVDEDEETMCDARKYREETASEDGKDEATVYAPELHLKKHVRGRENEP